MHAMSKRRSLELDREYVRDRIAKLEALRERIEYDLENARIRLGFIEQEMGE